MKRFSQQFKSKAEDISLQAQERHELRERLVSYMEYHPLNASSTLSSVSKAPMAEPYKAVRVDLFNISRFAGAFAVLAMIIVPVVAENTIPGDILYPVKVSFNEEVRSTLTFSPYEKVAWETERLERRIGEAQLLAEAGLLTPEVETKVAEAVKLHSDAAKKEIATLSESNSEEATFAQIALTSALEVQSEVLENQLSQTDAVDDTLATSSVAGGKSILSLAVDEARAQNQTLANENQPTTDRLLAHIESETTRAYEYLDSVNDVASLRERNDISRRLSDINTKVSKAVGNGSEEPNVEGLLAVVSDIQKLISFMTNIDVRANVSVEDLVPMVLTDEERIAAIQTNITQVTELQNIVAGRLEAMPSEIREKMELSFASSYELKTTASTSLQSKEINDAESAIKQALEIMLDMEIQTAVYQDSNSDVLTPIEQATSTPVEVLPSDLASTTPEITTNI